MMMSEVIEQDQEAPELSLVERAPAPTVRNGGAVAILSPMEMLSIAVQRGADIAQLNQLIDLKERMERTAAEQAFNEARAALTAEGITVLKDKRVHFASRNGGATTDYKHAELSSIVEALAEPMARNGLSFSHTIEQERDWITVKCILAHKLGHRETVQMSAPPDATGNKSPAQQVASTITLLRRHTLKAVTGIAERGDDDDGRGGHKGDHTHHARDNQAREPDPELKPLLDQLAKITDDQQAREFWLKHRDETGKTTSGRYIEFKNAVAAHRVTLAQQGAKQ
jgi:hypothetical protein